MTEERNMSAIEGLEGKVSELETLADSLETVPDEEAVEMLGRAVELLGEINAGIESNLRSVRQEDRAIGEILDNVDFGPFDEALEEIQHRENPSVESER